MMEEETGEGMRFMEDTGDSEEAELTIRPSSHVCFSMLKTRLKTASFHAVFDAVLTGISPISMGLIHVSAVRRGFRVKAVTCQIFFHTSRTCNEVGF